MTTHKRLVTETTVRPKGRKQYIKTNYQQVACLMPWSYLPAEDLVTNRDEDVTCPECLRKMGGK